MGKRRKYGLLLGVALVAVGVVVVLSRSGEPAYGGRRLSEWVDGYATRYPNSESDEAIRQIGTNAIPYLLKWIQYETPGWKSALRGLKPSWELSSRKERRAS